MVVAGPKQHTLPKPAPQSLARALYKEAFLDARRERLLSAEELAKHTFMLRLLPVGNSFWPEHILAHLEAAEQHYFELTEQKQPRLDAK